MSHTGKVLLKVVARRLSACCEAKGLLPEEQCGCRPNRSTTDMMFVVRRLQEIGRKAGVPLFMCFIDLQKAYDTVDRTLLWQVLTSIGVPPQMIAVIQQFHDGMRACVQPDDASVWIGSRWSKDYGKDACYPRCLKKNQNAPRLSEHPPVRGKKCQNV